MYLYMNKLDVDLKFAVFLCILMCIIGITVGYICGYENCIVDIENAMTTIQK